MANIVTDPASTSFEDHLAKLLDGALNSGSPTWQVAEELACHIDAAYRAQDADAEALLWGLWALFTQTARRVGAADERSGILPKTVQSLKEMDSGVVTIWGNEARIWGDLPLLGPSLREHWNRSPEVHGDEKPAPDAYTAQEWVSLNSFAARLLGTSTTSWTNFGLWEIRSALEETPSTTAHLRETVLFAACEWVLHAGPVLYEESQSHRELDDHDARSLMPGELVSTGPGFSKERWVFWRERFAVLGGQAGEDVRGRVEETVALMKELER